MLVQISLRGLLTWCRRALCPEKILWQDPIDCRRFVQSSTRNGARLSVCLTLAARVIDSARVAATGAVRSNETNRHHRDRRHSDGRPIIMLSPAAVRPMRNHKLRNCENIVIRCEMKRGFRATASSAGPDRQLAWIRASKGASGLSGIMGIMHIIWAHTCPYIHVWMDRTGPD